MQRLERANRALGELSIRLRVPTDMISVHRRAGSNGRPKIYQSLRYGSFLLAYAAFEGFFDNILNYRAATNRTISISPDKLRHLFETEYNVKNVTANWAARARVRGPFTGGNRPRWELLRNNRLYDYLSDAQQLRHILSHGADPHGHSDKSGILYPLSGGGTSLQLLIVEGFLQAVTDISSQTALAVGGPAVTIPEWPTPLATRSFVNTIPTPY